MDKEIILLNLVKVLEKDIEEVKLLPENASLSDFGLESIKFIYFIVEIENAFNIEIEDSDLLIDNFITISKTYKTLEKYFISQEVKNSLKKCLVLDCDGVLWKGVAGEETIIIDEKTLLFLNELIKLYEHGILLCICSKNSLNNITEAFNLPDMILKQENIAINKNKVNNKAESIKEIAVELNLFYDSFVFIDDDDYEIGLINSFVPEIEVVKADYKDKTFIEKIKNHFNFESIPQDLNRTKLFKEQKERVKAQALFNSIDDYNSSLETKIICDIAILENAERISELSRRTNRFNLSCKHYSTNEIEAFINSNSYTVLYLSASDKYGDMGIVAAAIIKQDLNYALIENFMLSCRVIGRGFEYVIINKVKDILNNLSVFGEYILNEKNKENENFYKDNGVKTWKEAMKS